MRPAGCREKEQNGLRGENMGERWLFDQLEWNVDFDAACKKLHVMEDDLDDFEEIYGETVKRMKPVFYAGRERILSNDGHSIVLGGEHFESRVISVNLKDSDTVYPFVGTSGRAAYEYALSISDELFRYWADSVCELALRSASVSFRKAMRGVIGSDNINSLAPGSVIDWPISQQKPLFALLGNVLENTGIYLEPSFLMRPVKSGSGILYASEKHFESCSLCPRQDCPNRRAPFDSEKFGRDYGEKNE